MRIVYFGSGEFAVPTLRALANTAHDVVAVITQPSRPSGRGRKLTPTPTAEWGAKLELPVIEAQNVNDPELVNRIRGLAARLGVVVAFGQKLGRELITSMRCGCVNVHASLLPKYRGAAPINWAILNGELKTGVTVFRLTDRIDAGEILVQRQTMICEDETAGELHDRLARIGPDAIKAALEMFEQDDEPRGYEQDATEVSVAPKLTKESGLLDFRYPATVLVRQVRAMSPWPGARGLFCSASGSHREEVTFVGVRAVERPGEVVNRAPGTLTDLYEVVTGQGTLELHVVKPAGGRAMAWQDFVNGRHVQPEDRFETISAS
ncbi:MAG: methionyl-tRNA formyltransferase [Phycisphaerae bacterium]|nr:methionyl-tRNA formyltransferase [Phycisphaerae bacterium]